MGYLNNNGLSTLITLIKNALGSKVDKVTGKQLSTNDFTNELKTKVESYEPLQQATTDTLGGIVLGDAFQVDNEGKTQVTNAEIGVRGVVALSNDINSTSVTSAATPALVQSIREASEGIPRTEKGVANGVATLDGNALVPIDQLPEATTAAKGITLLDIDPNSTSKTKAATPYVISELEQTVNNTIATTVEQLQQQMDTKISSSEKGVAGGVVPLNDQTKIDNTYLDFTIQSATDMVEGITTVGGLDSTAAAASRSSVVSALNNKVSTESDAILRTLQATGNEEEQWSILLGSISARHMYQGNSGISVIDSSDSNPDNVLDLQNNTNSGNVHIHHGLVVDNGLVVDGNNIVTAISNAQSTANNANTTASAAMPKAGGTFTGAVSVPDTNSASLQLRNIVVQDSAANFVSTGFIIAVRK